MASDISRSLVVLSGIGPRWRRSEQESSSRANGRTRLRHRSGKLALSCVTDRCEPRRREVFSRALVGDTGTDGPTPRVTTSGSKRRPNSRAASATSPQPPSIISPCPRPGVYRGRGGPVGTTETARDAPRRGALSSYNRGVKSVSVPQRSDRQNGRRQDRPPSQNGTHALGVGGLGANGSAIASWLRATVSEPLLSRCGVALSASRGSRHHCARLSRWQGMGAT